MNRTRLIIAACLSTTSLLAFAANTQTPEQFLQGRVYELRREASPASCHEWTSGLPNGVWGNSGAYGQATERLIEQGEVLVASATYTPTGERVSHYFYKSREACQKELSKKPAATLTDQKTVASTNTEAAAERLSYVERLQRDYGKRIHFSSPKAEALVKKITIDCKSRDGRYLPLYHALLARLDEASEADAWMETRVINKGNDISVYDSVHLKNGKELTPQLTMEINQWGNVKTYGVRPKALSNACFGSYGPIWKI